MRSARWTLTASPAFYTSAFFTCQMELMLPTLTASVGGEGWGWIKAVKARVLPTCNGYFQQPSLSSAKLVKVCHWPRARQTRQQGSWTSLGPRVRKGSRAISWKAFLRAPKFLVLGSPCMGKWQERCPPYDWALLATPIPFQLYAPGTRIFYGPSACQGHSSLRAFVLAVSSGLRPQAQGFYLSAEMAALLTFPCRALPHPTPIPLTILFFFGALSPPNTICK